MSAPMRQLVERGPVIAPGFLECVFRRQMYAVFCAAVKGPIRLIMSNVRAGISSGFARPLEQLRKACSLWAGAAELINLLSVEHRIHAVDELRFSESACGAVPASVGSVLSEAGFTSQYSIWVPFSPRRTCHPLSIACLYVIHRGSW